MASVSPSVSAADTSSLNTVAADFLEWVDQAKVFDLIWENNPTLTIISKKADVAGAYYDQSVVFGGSGGTTLGSYANALGNQTPQKQVTFHVPMTELFHLGTLDGHAIEASRQKKGAFVPLVEEALESGIKIAANKLSKYLLGSGTATIGQVSAITLNPSSYPSGSAQVTLASSLQYQQFEQGATYDATLSDGSAPLGAPDTVQCLAVDAAAGILVFSAPINSSTGNTSGSWGAGYWVVGNYLIQDGDYNANAFSGSISTQTGISAFQPANFAGMGAWIPSYSFRQNPGLAAGTFFNVPRNLDGTRLAGIAFNGANMAIDKALIGASIQAAIYGDGEGPEYCSINPTSYNALLNLLQGQKLYIEDEISANISYKQVLVLQGGSRALKVMMDRNVPARTAYLWSPDDFMLVSTGGCPRPLLYESGNTFLSLPNQNASQYRIGGYSNLVCKKPRSCVNVTLQQ